MKRGRFILLAAIPMLTFAQGTSTRYAELKFPGTARIAALASSPLTDFTLETSLTNPAALSGISSSDILLSHVSWFQDIQKDLLAASLPLSFVDASFSVNTTGIGGIEIRDIPGPAVASFTARTSLMQISISKTILENLSIGFTGKYLYQKIYVDESSGYAADCGVLWNGGSWKAAVVCTNFGTLSAMRQEAGDLPTALQAGGSYNFPVDLFDNNIYATYSSNLIVADNHVRLGIESVYDRVLSFRLGYQTGYETQNISAGVGIVCSFVRLDYAYVPFLLDFGNANIFTMTFTIQ
jgi:hypothetical protein